MPPSAGPPSASSRPANDKIAQFYQLALTAWEKVHDTSRAEVAREIQAADQLTTRIEQAMSANLQRIRDAYRHKYGVYVEGGALRRRQVLRDITELEGRTAEFSSDDFSTALHAAYARLQDPMLREERVIQHAEAVASLRLLRDTLQAGAQLSGQGTAAAPYATAAGQVLHVQAPVTLGVQGIPADQLVLTNLDGRLQLTRRSPSTHE